MSSDEAVLSTLVYASLFKSAISKRRLFDWLITDVHISINEFSQSLKVLQKRKLIFRDGDFFTLSKYPIVNPSKKKKIASNKMHRAKEAIRSIVWIPWITGIALTGSVAAENASQDEDIDVMIITSINALWMTRLLVSLLFVVQGKLRLKHKLQVQNKLCLNLWLDESALQMRRQTLYIAREVLQAQWIFQRGNAAEEFLRANKWISQLLAQVRIPKKTNQVQKFPLALINDFCYWMQRIWMGKISRKEKVNRHFAFFHPADKSSTLMREYQMRRNKILKEYYGI